MVEWRPAPGQVAVVEVPSHPSPLSGVVVDDDGPSVLIDLGPRAPALRPTRAEVAFAAADALYRVAGELRPSERAGVVRLVVGEVERVDRRRAPRVRCVVPAALSGFSEGAAFVSAVGRSVDVGAGGAKVRVADPLPDDVSPTLTLLLERSRAIVAVTEVLQLADADGLVEYRLAYLGLPDPDRERLDVFLERHLGPR